MQSAPQRYGKGTAARGARGRQSYRSGERFATVHRIPIASLPIAMQDWIMTYHEYCLTVIGERDADDLAREFDLDLANVRGMDEWLGRAEVEALHAGGLTIGDMPDSWREYHARLLEDLTTVH